MKPLLIGAFVCLTALPALAADMTYSAIAISPNTGAWGRAYDWPDQAKAESVAVDYCRQNSSQPDDCRSVTWSRGVYCAAVAVKFIDSGGVTWGSASAANVDAARALAMDTCKSYNGGNICDKVLVDVCSH